MTEEQLEQWARDHGFVRVPAGWRVVPENPTDRQRNLMRREDNPVQAYIVGVKAAPILA